METRRIKQQPPSVRKHFTMHFPRTMYMDDKGTMAYMVVRKVENGGEQTYQVHSMTCGRLGCLLYDLEGQFGTPAKARAAAIRMAKGG